LFKASQAPAPSAEQTTSKAEEIARQVQPNRSASSTAPVSQQGKVFTDLDIQKMFRRAIELSAKGQNDEARKLEAEIDSAYKEGRVRA
jgi:hypothetical protein